MSKIRNGIASAVRTRLQLEFTGARDLSASPYPVAGDKLPAYAVKVESQSTEPAEMGSSQKFIAKDRISVLAWAEGDPSTEATLWAFADEIFEVVSRAPENLGGLVEHMVAFGSEVRPWAAASRVWSLEFAIDVIYLETPTITDFDAGFSLGFRA